MRVVKRNGNTEPVCFDKVLNRITNLCNDESIGEKLSTIDPAFIAQKIIQHIVDGITTSELDTHGARLCMSYITRDPEYDVLSVRLQISNMHKEVPNFVDTVEQLHKDGRLSDDYYKKATESKLVLNTSRDYNFTTFGLTTLKRGYLLTTKDGQVTETPQYMWARIAITLHDNLEDQQRVYDDLSQGFYIHATPTLFNAGTKHQQLSSCFLIGIDDSLDSILGTLGKCGQISKYSGGIGIGISNIRCEGSYIHGTGGKSNGILPMIKVYNELFKYVNQGGKRKGSCAMYIEPHHHDIVDFLMMRLNQRPEALSARDIFQGLWISDYFMECVTGDTDWYLMDPNECSDLVHLFGEAYTKKYKQYVSENKYTEKVRARDVWQHILKAQQETGMPYISFKDAVNRKNNQAHLGTITHSNLCNEITLFSNHEEFAVCNLSSIALPRFVVAGQFDFDLLAMKTKQIVKNLDSVIDQNYYPVPETRKSNMAHRPIGIGVQGFADTLILLGMSFVDSDGKSLPANTRAFNKRVFETIQHAAYTASAELAGVKGAYPSYKDSPAARGILQHDLWRIEGREVTETLDWSNVRDLIEKNGLRNSVMTALMPTASTSQILGWNEAMEPFTSNLYIRNTLSGDFPVINRHLVKELKSLGKWNKEVVNTMSANQGSIAKIRGISDEMKRKFRTVWEIPQKNLIELSADRGPFIDQTQSFNLFLKDDYNQSRLSSALVHGWKLGLKTGMYYLRSQAPTTAASVALQSLNSDSSFVEQHEVEEKREIVCTDEICLACQ